MDFHSLVAPGATLDEPAAGTRPPKGAGSGRARWAPTTGSPPLRRTPKPFA